MLVVLAATLAAAHAQPARADGIRGSWSGVTYQKIGGRGQSPIIVRVDHLRTGRRAGRVTYPRIPGSRHVCRGPIRYLGRSPRGGYRFLYRETNSAGVADGECGAGGHILLVRHGARLFIRDSDLQWPPGGGVDLGLLTRLAV